MSSFFSFNSYSSAETTWSIIDTCPDRGRRAVATGRGYTIAGKLETAFIVNRNSRYLFSILDAGGDGICCNTGHNGSYKVFVDNALQIAGGEFGYSDFQFFGACTETTTYKPTNVVHNFCSQLLSQLIAHCYCVHCSYSLLQAQPTTLVSS